MIGVILTILKVIGIIVAILLGFILLILIAALFVPVRYRIKVSKHEKIDAKIKFSWLLHFVFVLLNYENNNLAFKIKILGITFYDSKRPKKKKRLSKQKNQSNHKPTKEEKNEKRNIETLNTEYSKEMEIKQQEISKVIEDEKFHKEENVFDYTVNQSEEKPKEVSRKEKKQSKSRMKNRIKQILKSMIHFPKKVICLIKKIKEKIRKVFKMLKKIMKYPKLLREFITDEENKTAFGMIFLTIKKVLNHTKPKVVTGYVEFGFDDPCTTGEVLGLASVLYAFLNLKRFRIYPDFENEKFETQLDAKGRIRGITLIKLVVKLLRDEHFKKLRKQFGDLKGGLKNVG